jgi:hypothetical protein
MKKILLSIFLTLFLTINISYASSIDSLINSYNYDFNSGDINVTQISDSLIDTNSNSLGDRLDIIFTTNISNSSYIAIISLEDNNIHTNYTYLNSQTNTISFQTQYLTQDSFKYSLEIRDETFSLLYRKDNISTSTYNTYESGFEVGSITDSNFQININLENITSLGTHQLTIPLNYMDNTLTHIQNITLNSFSELVTVTIPEEKIKQTHYNGVYTIPYILINQKKITTNYTTQSYNFENYVTTNYIKDTTYSFDDLNNNSYYDLFEIQTNLEIKEVGEYSIEATLLDSDEQLINKYNSTQSLVVGNNLVTLPVNIVNLYRKKIQGPYTISKIKLIKNNSIEDSFNPEIKTVSVSYLNFEKPSLPDLSLSLDNEYNTTNNSNEIKLTIINNGTYPAYNVKVNLFGPSSFEKEISIPFIEINQTILFNITHQNITNGNLYTVIIDLQNTIDEIDETNNIVQEFSIGPSSINLEKEITVLDDSLIEISFTNTGTIPMINNEFTFGNVNVSIPIIFQGEVQKIYLEQPIPLGDSIQTTFISKYYTEENIFTYDFSNISITTSILDSSLVEYSIENYENQSVTIYLDSQKIKLNPLSMNKIYMEYNVIPNTIKIQEKGLEKTYNLNEIEFDIIESVTQLDSNLYEIILHNTYNDSKEISFSFDSIQYSMILNPGNKKVLFIDSLRSGLLIENVSINVPSLIESVMILNDGSDKYLYEIILNNVYSSNKSINLSLGDFSYFSQIEIGERRVLYVDQSQNNLEIQDLQIN